MSDYFKELPWSLTAIASTLAPTEEMVTSGEYSGSNSSMAVNTRGVRQILRASEDAHISRLMPASLLELFQTAVDRGYGEADLPALYVAMSGDDRTGSAR